MKKSAGKISYYRISLHRAVFDSLPTPTPSFSTSLTTRVKNERSELLKTVSYKEDPIT